MAATPLLGSTQVNDAIASVVVTAFAKETRLIDLLDLNTSASNVMEQAVSELEHLSSSERRVLVFSLNLVKDIAMAKAVALVVSSESKEGGRQ